MQEIEKIDVSCLSRNQQIVLFIARRQNYGVTTRDMVNRFRLNVKYLQRVLYQLMGKYYITRKLSAEGENDRSQRGRPPYLYFPTREGVKYINYILDREGLQKLKVPMPPPSTGY